MNASNEKKNKINVFNRTIEIDYNNNFGYVMFKDMIKRTPAPETN